MVDEQEKVLNVKSNATHPTEEKYPIQTKAFKELINKMYMVHLDKNLDYSPANILYTGEAGVIIRVWDKFCRLCNLNGMEFPNIHRELNKLVSVMENSQEPACNFVINFRELMKDINFSKKEGTRKPTNEPIKDAWLDMAVYSIIGYLVHENCWGR